VPLNRPIRDWTARRVWVVGASQGIGAACAQALLARGARVAVSARRPDALEQVVQAAPPGSALVLPTDVTREDQVGSAFGALRAQWGGVDLVLIVAGTHVPLRAWELDAQRARALLEVNLMGVVNVVAAVLPALLEQGYRGLPTGLVYGASKAALINLAETMYLDLAPRGIDVYLINPGFVKTPLTDRNRFPMPALISAVQAAEHTLRGLERGRFEIDYPKRFTRVMKLLRLLPYRLYFALVRRVTGL
jgi:NAD(P)-dependent dehydrogenase (short-subunit alcohol dehydrogenase family)